ncbi:hypothetical protein [Vibrio gangliei]|uniref:hypothetical protein n=1 Tax=Vibrio gangliei TaxID=2077090 RepID=UPI000D02081A|nr:hypothetical protein [Vibrio gangliei]
MITSQEVALDAITTLDLIRSEALTKSAFDYVKAAKQIHVEPELFQQFLRVNLSIDLVYKGMANLPNPKGHPFICSENRQAFFENIVKASLDME